MEAKELKIGDWIYWFHETVRVVGIESTFINAIDKDGVSCPLLDISATEPISITEETLRKSGWMEDDGLWSIDYAYGQINAEFRQINTMTMLAISVNTGDAGDKTCALAQIRHVHELQHILWSLGVKDCIELNEETERIEFMDNNIDSVAEDALGELISI